MKEEVCETCGGQITPDKVTVRRWDTIILDVPAGICQFCGERYYEADTIDKLDVIAQESEGTLISFATKKSYTRSSVKSGSFHLSSVAKSTAPNKEERKELTQAFRAEILSDPLIGRQVEKMIGYLMEISEISVEEGKDASLGSVWDFVVAKMKEELAGVDTEGLSKEEIDVLAEIGFRKEVLKKVANCE